MPKKGKRKRGKKKYKNKNLIEVYTDRQGWVIAKLIKIKNRRVIIRLPDGNIVARKLNRIHWGLTYKVTKHTNFKN